MRLERTLFRSAQAVTPHVTARGDGGCLAEEIIRLTRAYTIPFAQPGLGEVLAPIEFDRKNPERLYRAVAELIAFAYLMRDQVLAGLGPCNGVGAKR